MDLIVYKINIKITFLQKIPMNVSGGKNDILKDTKSIYTAVIYLQNAVRDGFVFQNRQIKIVSRTMSY